MNRFICICLSFSLLLLLTGCLDDLQLTRRAFVMGIALDETEAGKVLLTTQVYVPSPKGEKRKGSKGYINVRTTGDTVAKAIRDIPIHLGRKTHWGHLRSIVISEKLARKKRMAEVLELFYRDHETRITSSVLISKGNAADYLKKEPWIEMTMGQQILANEESTADFSNKTVKTNLLTLILQTRSQVGNSIIPRIYIEEEHEFPSIDVAGIVLLKKNKMIGYLPPGNIEGLQIIRNEYRGGMLQILPCQTQPEKIEVVEVLSSQTTLKPVIKDESLNVQIANKMEIVLQELKCSRIDAPEKERKFVERLEQALKKELKETISLLQEKQFDAIDLGNKVYAKNPTLWKRWKNNWDQRFADSNFEFDVKIRIINSGTTNGKPMFSE
ncbi:Ger(x)C family spore germination protein [Ectobacillus funiculus]|uniref:Ger(x)C family spore germination protein n=1 Tax=Ectobacillus funiculus TaxID=137993 RepID=UPI00397CF375